MRKTKVAHLTQIHEGAVQTDAPKRNLAGAHEGTEQAIAKVRQLRGLSRTMAEIGPTFGEEPMIEAQDVVHMMALFSQNLEEVHDLLREVRTVMETINPLLLAVNE